MAGGEEDRDIALLKKKIVLVDKLVRNKQKNDDRNAELSAALKRKEQELADRDKELAELRAKPAETGNWGALVQILTTEY